MLVVEWVVVVQDETGSRQDGGRNLCNRSAYDQPTDQGHAVYHEACQSCSKQS